jgi:protein-S-isoprenylcysteine O-methyltransferase Ste14
MIRDADDFVGPGEWRIPLTRVDTPKYAVPPQVPPLVALALIVILDRVAPVPFLSRSVSLWIGIPLLVVGLAFWTWGVSGLLRKGETPNPAKATTRLVTAGPYRFSRNPIYTGGTLGLLGLALWLDTATGVAVVVALALVARHLMLAEEQYLEAKFGEEWRDYRARVRRWI